MQKTRKQVFETNSSSSHSLTLSTDEVVALPFSKTVLRNGYIEVGLEEYGWEWARYYTPKNKLTYLLTQMLGGAGTLPDGTRESVTQTLRETEPALEMLCSVVKEHTGCDLFVTPLSSGYVDHDSVGVGMSLFSDKEKLRQFLFSSTSYVQTGNDNDSPPKMITTDIGEGSEPYYVKSYLAPEDDWPMLPMELDSHTGELITDKGIKLSSKKNEELYKEVKAQATVELAHWVIFGFNIFQYEAPESYSLAEITKRGFYVSPQMSVIPEVRSAQSSNTRDSLTVRLRMPKELFEKIRKLRAPAKKATKSSEAESKEA